MAAAKTEQAAAFLRDKLEAAETAAGEMAVVASQWQQCAFQATKNAAANEAEWRAKIDAMQCEVNKAKELARRAGYAAVYRDRRSIYNVFVSHIIHSLAL